VGNKVDYPGAPGNYKYHSMDELERLKIQLEEEVNSLEGTKDRFRAKLVEEDKRMLHEIECEILERALLGYKPDVNESE
jgi:hypothetical protein